MQRLQPPTHPRGPSEITRLPIANPSLGPAVPLRWPTRELPIPPDAPTIFHEGQQYVLVNALKPMTTSLWQGNDCGPSMPHALGSAYTPSLMPTPCRPGSLHQLSSFSSSPRPPLPGSIASLLNISDMPAAHGIVTGRNAIGRMAEADSCTCFVTGNDDNICASVTGVASCTSGCAFG